MRRTSLVLDRDLLATATRVLGAKTYSAAVNQALEEILRVKKIRSLPEFFGQDLWQGDLAEMRQDRPKQARPKSGARKRAGRRS